MADQTIVQSDEVTKALRNAIQGRVLLIEDFTSGVDITVSQPVDIYGGEGNYGTVLFLNKTEDVTLVQPNTAGTGIEHSETATLVAVTAGDRDLAITAPAANSYTVARDAYVRPTTLPASVTDLQFVTQDLAFMQEPGITLPQSSMLVELTNVRVESGGHPQFRVTYNFRLKYFRTGSDGENHSTSFYGALDDIANLLFENFTLGGWVDDCEVTDVRRVPEDDRNAIYPFDYAYITLWAQIDRTYTKDFAS